MVPNNILIGDSVFFLVAKAANSSIKAAVKRFLGMPVTANTLHQDFERVTACEAAAMHGY
mgnify:CR=1 FL=1